MDELCPPISEPSNYLLGKLRLNSFSCCSCCSAVLKHFFCKTKSLRWAAPFKGWLSCPDKVGWNCFQPNGLLMHSFLFEALKYTPWYKFAAATGGYAYTLSNGKRARPRFKSQACYLPSPEGSPTGMGYLGPQPLKLGYQKTAFGHIRNILRNVVEYVGLLWICNWSFSTVSCIGDEALKTVLVYPTIQPHLWCWLCVLYLFMAVQF